jgi:hypothetical protein
LTPPQKPDPESNCNGFSGLRDDSWLVFSDDLEEDEDDERDDD